MTIIPDAGLVATLPAPLKDWQIDAEAEKFLEELSAKDARDRVVVQAYLPHLKKYNHDPMRDLVYRWPGGDTLAVGDLVLCPPTPMRPSEFEAIVVSLDADNHPYKGPVKNIIRKVTRQ